MVAAGAERHTPTHELVDASLAAGIGGRLVALGGTGLDPVRELEQRLVELKAFSRLEAPAVRRSKSRASRDSQGPAGALLLAVNLVHGFPRTGSQTLLSRLDIASVGLGHLFVTSEVASASRRASSASPTVCSFEPWRGLGAARRASAPRGCSLAHLRARSFGALTGQVLTDARGTSALSLRSASAASRFITSTVSTGTCAETIVFSATAVRKSYTAHGIAELVFIAAGIAPSKKGSRVA